VKAGGGILAVFLKTIGLAAITEAPHEDYKLDEQGADKVSGREAEPLTQLPHELAQCVPVKPLTPDVAIWVQL